MAIITIITFITDAISTIIINTDYFVEYMEFSIMVFKLMIRY